MNEGHNARAFGAQAFHNLPSQPCSKSPDAPYVDSRPRIDYVLADGTVLPIVHDHGDLIRPTVTFQRKGGEIVDAKLRDGRLAWTRTAL